MLPLFLRAFFTGLFYSCFVRMSPAHNFCLHLFCFALFTLHHIYSRLEKNSHTYSDPHKTHSLTKQSLSHTHTHMHTKRERHTHRHTHLHLAQLRPLFDRFMTSTHVQTYFMEKLQTETLWEVAKK